MKAEKNGQYITISLEPGFEVDIMAACLNFGYSAMKRAGLITCDGSPADDAKAEVEKVMFEVFERVHPYSRIGIPMPDKPCVFLPDVGRVHDWLELNKLNSKNIIRIEPIAETSDVRLSVEDNSNEIQRTLLTLFCMALKKGEV